MMKLQEIKQQIEREYDVEFRENYFLDLPNLFTIMKDKGELNIHISQYNTNDERNGTDFISVSFQSKRKDYYGWGRPCDNIEEVYKCLDGILQRKIIQSLF